MVGGISAGIGGGGGLGSYGMDVSGGYDMGNSMVEGAGSPMGSSAPSLQEVDGFDEAGKTSFDEPGKTSRIDARSERVEDASGPEKPREDRTDLQALLEELLKMATTCGQCGRPMLQCLCLFGM
jgi:hypothetical protein